MKMYCIVINFISKIYINLFLYSFIRKKDVVLRFKRKKKRKIKNYLYIK